MFGLALLGVLGIGAPVRAERQERPRAAAVVATPPETPMERRAGLARAALSALDRFGGVRALRSPALRRALVPRTSVPDPVARADALATSAPLVAPNDPSARARIFEQALGVVFSQLTPAQAREWLGRFGTTVAATLARAKRSDAATARRLARWQGKPPAKPTGHLTLKVTPADARVFLDGRLVGTGPEVELRHGAGAHDLYVALEGWSPIRRQVRLGQGGKLALGLERADPTADLQPLLGRMGAAHDDVQRLLPLLRRLGRRLDVDLIFLCTPEAGATLVRLYDVRAEGFVAASPTAASDAATLARAFRAAYDLRGLVRPRRRASTRRRRKRRGGAIRKLWKKWWFWALVLGGAGAATGAILLSQQGSTDGTLTVRLRRLP